MHDLLLTGELDLDVSNGDFSQGETTAQHQKLLLLAHPGDFMQHPDSGVGIESYLNDERDNMMTDIRSQFEIDGMKVNSLAMNGSEIQIDAAYK